jgi:hypothetical protein
MMNCSSSSLIADIHCNPSHLIAGERLSRRSSPRLFLEIDVRELLPVCGRGRQSRLPIHRLTRAAGSGDPSLRLHLTAFDERQAQPLRDEVKLPANRFAYAVLKKETGRTAHSILRIASWGAKIGGSIKRKIPLRRIVALIRDANPSVIVRVEIAVRTLSHRWAGCKNGPAEKAGRNASFCNSPHGVRSCNDMGV